MSEALKVTGSGGGGGGGKGGGGGTGGTEAPNSLKSNSIARIVELLGEGEIVGLVDGAKSIYFNQTPLQNSDGSSNFGGLFTFNSANGQYTPITTGTAPSGEYQWFNGVTWDQRVGLPDQAVVAGFAQSETAVGVNEQVKASIGPVVRTITDENVNSVKVIVNVPSLSYLDPNNGDLQATSLSWTVDVRPYGGVWSVGDAVTLSNQKCTSAYQHQSTVTLPAGGAPWDIRVNRTTADSADTANLNNDTYFESYTEVVLGQFTYGNSALIALGINAEYFGSSIPTRGYHVKGLKTEIPSNYDPITRVYTGVWDGTFVKAWHNNPAWVLYALLTNDRWGIGEYIDATTVDKWGFYQIATYCDAMIPSGFTTSTGDIIYEPRFTYNGVINTREEAYKVLQSIAAVFRGMAFWSLGQVFAVADMPADAMTTVSPANVIGGHFNYSGTALKARHSVAMVTWNNPDDFYRPNVEVVQSDTMIQRFGWRQIDVVASGCTSRGQAHRYGKWILDTEENETETVDFEMSWDGYILESGTTLKPGDIILVADPRKTGGARIGGRLAEVASTSVVTIDAPFVPTLGETYSLTTMMPDGTIETVAISGFSTDNSVLTLGTAYTQTPQVGAMWVIQGTDVNPRRYRVLSVQEKDSHIFKVTALFNDPTKYARVEQNVSLTPVTYTRPNNIIAPPTSPTIVESNYFENGSPQSRITLSWTAPQNAVIAGFKITADSPRGIVDFGTTLLNSIDLFNITPGDWVFYISTLAFTGLTSVKLPIAHTVQGWSVATVPTAGSLSLLDGGTIFTGSAPTIVWTNSFPSGEVVYPLENIVRIYDTTSNALLRTETITGTSYTYSFEKNENDGGPRRSLAFSVTAKSLLGIEQGAPATIQVTNPSPAAVTPTVEAVGIALTANWIVTDNDYFKSEVWVSPTSGFNPLTTPSDYDGPDTRVILNQPTPGTFYVRVGAYDMFGKVGMNIGPEVSIVCTGTDLASFNSQLRDHITTQIKDTNDSIKATQGLIATIAAEQDAANWIDKKNIRNEMVSAVSSVGQASVAAIAEASATAEAALANYQLVVNAQLNGTPAAVTISLTDPTVIGWTGHGFYNGQGITFTTDGVLPAAMTIGQVYYVTSSNIDDFQISDTVGGVPLSTQGQTQSGTHIGTPQGFAAGITTSATAIATIDGKVAGQWLVTIDANGYVSGLQAYNNGQTANMTIIADNFQVASPANEIGASSVITASIAIPCVIDWTAHGYSVGQRVRFTTTGALPTGITPGVWYYIISTGLTADQFQVSATDGGAAIDTSGTQSGIHTGVAAGGGLPKPMFSIANINGVPQLVMDGLMISDGSITAQRLNVAELTAITQNFGSAIVSGDITSQNGKMLIDFSNNRIVISD